MNISRLIAGLAILFLSTVSQADCLEDGKEKQPAFARNANTSWSAFEETIIGGISCFIDGEMAALRMRWTPDSDLEILDLDEVLESN